MSFTTNTANEKDYEQEVNMSFLGIEQENTSQLGVMSRGSQPGIAPATHGKIFQQARKGTPLTSRSFGGKIQSITTQPASRHALGNINVNKQAVSQTKQRQATKASNGQSLKPQGNKVTEAVKQSSEVRSKVVPSQELPEPEFANNKEELDTYDDLWAISERPSRFLHCLLDWRPNSLNPCIFSDDLNSSQEITYTDDPIVSLPDISVEGIDCSFVDEPDLPLPSLEDILGSDQKNL